LPPFEDWQIGAIHLFEDIVEGFDGATQHGGVGEVELKALFLEYLSALDGLLFSLGGELGIVPAGPLFELVVLRLSVPHDH
jgi:hypothetical protein